MIVVEASERCEGSDAHGVGEVDLRTRSQPHLQGRDGVGEVDLRTRSQPHLHRRDTTTDLQRRPHVEIVTVLKFPVAVTQCFLVCVPTHPHCTENAKILLGVAAVKDAKFHGDQETKCALLCGAHRSDWSAGDAPWCS